MLSRVGFASLDTECLTDEVPTVMGYIYGRFEVRRRLLRPYRLKTGRVPNGGYDGQLPLAMKLVVCFEMETVPSRFTHRQGGYENKYLDI